MGAASAVQRRSLICFGRFSEHKNIPALFPILQALHAKHPAWRLIIAGPESGVRVEQLKVLAAVAGVADLVRFSVHPSDEELRKLIGEASYFASLSHYEGFGLAAVEAMSAGLFPILSGIAPFRRLVDETGLGIIADPSDPAATATQIEASVSASGDVYATRQARLVDAVQRYNWETAAAKYLHIYEEVVSARSQRAGLAFK